MIILGLDAGSTTCKAVAINDDKTIIYKSRKNIKGDVLKTISLLFPDQAIFDDVSRIGVTGSSKMLVAKHFGTSITSSEIIAHAAAAKYLYSDVGTLIEIGGQDAKYIQFKNNIVKDFSMNNSCGAGTGAFLENQCSKLGINICELDMYAKAATKDIVLKGKCGVFLESAVLNYQRLGESAENIALALCKALVYNYINEFCKGKAICEPVCFQGGVAKSRVMKNLFSEILGKNICVDEKYCQYMGAIGSALIAYGKKEEPKFQKEKMVNTDDYERKNSFCNGCRQSCMLMEYYVKGVKKFRLGGKCGRYDVEKATN